MEIKRPAVAEKPFVEINAEVAKKMVSSVERWAGLAGFPCSIAVANGKGEIVATHKMDKAPDYSPGVAQNKAITVMRCGCSTLALSKKYSDSEQVKTADHDDMLGMVTQEDGQKVCIIPGGEPIINDAMAVVGAVGVSGFSNHEGDNSDMRACEVGIAALWE